MAGLGFKDFQVGEVLTSSDVDGYLMQQTVMRFADSAARGSALGTAVGTGVALAEGMVTYLDDVNQVQVFDGTSWAATGKLLQVVSATKTDTFATTSSTYVDITDLAVTLTPASAASKILIMFYGQVGNSNQNDSTFIQFVRDSTAVFIGDAAGNRTRASTGLYFGNVSKLGEINVAAPATFVDSPATTASITYKAQMRISGNAGTNTAYLGRIGTNDANSSQRGRYPSSLIAVEIAG